MTYVNATRNTANDLNIAIGIFSLISRISALIARFKDYRDYRRTVSELSVLTARELNDLGIDRSMITSISIHAVYGTEK